MTTLQSVRPGQAQDPNDVFEVFWQLRHGGVVNTVVTSRYDGTHFYLSLQDIFSSLSLNLAQEPAAGRATGFFVSTDRPYRLDFLNLEARIGERVAALDSTEFIATDLGYYVHPDALRRIFGLDFTLDERQLTLRLQTEDEMPVVTAYLRQVGLSRRRLYRPELMEEHAPLLYGRQRSILSGGVMGYRLGLTMHGTSPRGSLNLRGGGELLGGDAEFNLFTSFTGGADVAVPTRFDVGALRWRYALDGGPLLRQVRVGRLSTTGLRNAGFEGISLTNDPVQVERFFGSSPLRVETGPEWELELYLNNQLIEARRADATGVQDFQVPITYGSTQIRIVEYGPNGEVISTERRIEVPFVFVPRGQVRYTLNAGNPLLEGRGLLQATTSVGVTRSLTVTAGADYLGMENDSSAAGVYAGISTRLGDPFILTATVAPGELYSAGVTANHSSYLTYSIEFRSYGAEGLYNRTRSQHQTQASLTAPLRFRGMPLYLRANLNERKTRIGGYEFHLTPELSIQPGPLQLNLGYRTSAAIYEGRYRRTSRVLETRVGYALPRSPRAPTFFSGALLSARASYDFRDNRLQSFNGSASRTISSRARAQFDVAHLPISRMTTVSFGLQLTMPYGRASGGVQAGTSLPITWSQDISGAISYDASTRSLKALQQDWVGQAAATVRLFLDENGNGRYDEGETGIPNGALNFRRGVSMQPGPDGVIVVSNLQPYEQYSLTIDQTRIRNPLWVPRFEEFSFIADPNQHKRVDVPFYVSGEVSGSVLAERNGAEVAVPGLKVHFHEVDGSRSWEQTVFGDGSFSLVGLPPGDYEVRVDSAQLAMLQMVSEPSTRNVTLAATSMGDFVTDVDFLLRPVELARDERPGDVVDRFAGSQPTVPEEYSLAEVPPP